MQRITATTVLSDVLPSLAFTDASAERLEAAKDEVAQLRTPKQVVRQLEAARQAAEALCGSLETRQGLTSKQAVDELGALRTAAKAANAIADKVESLTADQKVIKSVGSDAWMNLIQAAAEFVEENQSEKLELKQRCPLCLEKLPDSAKARLTRFWEAVHGQASEQRASAETALQQRIDELAEIAKGRAELEALVTVVEPHAPLLRLSFDAAMTSTEATVKKLKSSKPTNGVDISDALDGVRKAVTTIAGKSAALENGTVGAAAEVARLNREIQELEARKLLAGRTGPIQEYVTALRMADQLDAAHASIKTLGATQKSGDLNERYITDSYRTGVEAELKRLGFARPVPVLTQQGSKGKIRILTLANPKFKNVAPDQIFSEGERTAIAIASFFSELGLTPSPVGLIFDDPISSLDHRTREKVAERLVAEAARRQVIVFTHDLVFLTELNGFAREKAVPVTTCELSSTSSVVGLVATDPPWDTQKVSARATKLEGLLADATAEDAAGDAAGLALTLDHFYRLMRSTWEQFIEEKLLNGALERFSRHIKPNSLLEVSFDKSLVKKVVNQINELSGLIEAHDHSAAMNAPRLTVADAAGRLRALRDAGSLETSS